MSSNWCDDDRACQSVCHQDEPVETYYPVTHYLKQMYDEEKRALCAESSDDEDDRQWYPCYMFGSFDSLYSEGDSDSIIDQGTSEGESTESDGDDAPVVGEKNNSILDTEIYKRFYYC
jgi:hypothetical protein